MSEREVTITFKGVPASGKTTFLNIAARAIEAAGHKILSYDPDSNCLKAALYHSPLKRRTVRNV